MSIAQERRYILSSNIQRSPNPNTMQKKRTATCIDAHAPIGRSYPIPHFKPDIDAIPDRKVSTNLDLEAESSHAGLVLVDGGLAFLRRIVGLRKQHAVIPGCLLGLADAAGLWSGGYPSVHGESGEVCALRGCRINVPSAFRRPRLGQGRRRQEGPVRPGLERIVSRLIIYHCRSDFGWIEMREPDKNGDLLLEELERDMTGG